MNTTKIKKTLTEMIDAYESGDGTDDMGQFITTWAALLTPDPKPATTPDLEVLISGDPFDGLVIEGPYPAGTLSDCEIYVQSPWWIVNLDKPSIETEQENSK
jgi:hypothetical protein